MTKAIRWSPEQLAAHESKLKTTAARKVVRALRTQSEEKPRKYRNKKCEFEGMSFDSQAELRRYHELRTMERAGLITALERQVVYILAPAVRIQGRMRPPMKYIADYRYVEIASGKQIINDVKGKLDRAYIIKRHLMAAMGFEILETK